MAKYLVESYYTCSFKVKHYIDNLSEKEFGKIEEILVCGGGRKNESLLMSLSKKIPKRFNIKEIDNYEINGDFVESQAFAFLAIRSFIKLPITFPNTTGCTSPCLGGVLLSR